MFKNKKQLLLIITTFSCGYILGLKQSTKLDVKNARKVREISTLFVDAIEYFQKAHLENILGTEEFLEEFNRRIEFIRMVSRFE